MGRSWRRAGYGCSPDIATHGPRPQEGAGEERRRRGWGGGRRQKCLGILLPAAPTPPAPAALLPRPRRGRGPCPGVYQGSSRIRGFSGISPCAGPWWISPRGERLTGRGNLFPLPCLPHSNHLTSRRHPPPHPRLCRQRHSYALLRHPRPTRACGAPPPPRPGRGPCPGVYQESSRIRGGASGPPCSGFLRDLAVHWTMVAMCDRQ